MAADSKPSGWPSTATAREFAGTERYEIVREIGKGGMGVVYEAIDRLRGRHVALKTLSTIDADGIYRIKQEFRSLSDASHPNLAKLHELVNEDGAWFFTMELVPGQDFLHWVHGPRPAAPAPPEPEEGSPSWSAASGAQVQLPIGDEEETEPGGLPSSAVPLPEVQPYGSTPKGQAFRSVREADLERLGPALGQLVEGVMALHEMGRLHRDIKPSNVLVTETGRVVLLDFGLVTPMYDQFIIRSTVQGLVCGTVAYMSPEQSSGEALTPTSDWYSLGVILFEALTGRLPFTGTMFRVLMDKQRFPAPAPRDLVPDVPEHLDELCQRLLSQDPTKRPEGPAILEVLGRQVQVDLTPSVTFPINLPGQFVGRAAELEALDEAYRRARTGRAQVVLVEGRSGVGKSALIRRFLDAIDPDQNSVVFSGRCHERELVPFKGIDGVIDALSRYLRRLPYDEAQSMLPSDAPLICRLFPVVGRVEAIAALADPAEGSGATLELRRRAFDALRTLLDRVARRTTLVLFLDDLQWGDADSGDLLSHLLAPPEPPPLLVLGSYRIEDRDASPLLDVIGALEQAPRGLVVTRVLLGPLGLEDAEGLARRLLVECGISPTDPELGARAKLVALESGGDPLFVYELARRDREGLDLEASVLDEATPMRQMRLERVLFERIRNLPFDARRLLEVIAVAAGPLPVRLANEASGLASGDDAQADLLKGQRLLRSSMGDTPNLEVYHDRIRETLSRNLTPEVLKAHHLSLARTLEGAETVDPEAMVFHLESAGEKQRALRYARTAAQAAFSAMAFERAASLYATALELTDPDSPKRWQIIAWRAESLASAGRGEDAAHAYRAASKACGGDQGFELMRRSAEQFLTSGHVDKGLEILSDLLEQVGLRFPKSPAHAMRAVAMMRARFAVVGVRFEAKPSRDIPRLTKQQIDVCWSLATGLAMVDFVRGAFFAVRMLGLSLGAGDRLRAVRALAVEGVSVGGMERNEERANRMLRLLERTAEPLDHPQAKALVRMTWGFAAYLRAQWKRAEEELDAALEIFTTQCTGVAWEINTARLIRVEALSNQGRYREVGASMRRSMAQAAALKNRYVTSTYRIFPYVTVVWLAVDEADRARRELEAVAAGLEPTGFNLQSYSVLVSSANIDLYEGNGLGAWKRVQAGWPALESSLILKMQLLASEAHYLRARAALAAAYYGGDTAALQKVATESGKALADLTLGHAPALVALVKAQKATLRGRSERARELFAEARQGFEAADMGLYAAVAARREGELTAGDQGRFIVERADRAMVEQGIAQPERMAALFAPVSGAAELP